MDEINMKEQVKQRVLAVMDQEQLSDAQFAESIGISRGAVSQIKSGRSYPSLDVALKILDRFPYLNPDWLLLGKGEMRRPDTDSMAQPVVTDENPTIFRKIWKIARMLGLIHHKTMSNRQWLNVLSIKMRLLRAFRK